MSYKVILKALSTVATKIAKRNDIPLSLAYDIARDVWSVYWMVRRIEADEDYDKKLSYKGL